MLKILKALERGKTLDNALPGGWWIENERVDGRLCFRLLRLCLIRKTYTGKDIEMYQINEDGSAVLRDPDYVPKIVAVRKEPRQ